MGAGIILKKKKKKDQKPKKTRETPQHYIKGDLKRVPKHGTYIIGHRQQHKGQEGRDNNTSHEAATTVSKNVHD